MKRQQSNFSHFLAWMILLTRLMTAGIESTVLPIFANQTERLALLDLRSSITQDPLQITSSWNDSTHFCNWVGVTCDASNGRVVNLDLGSQRLAGSVPPSIGNLSYLTGINLRNNSFTGKLPQELGKLVNLRHLNLSMNSFASLIPTNLTHCVSLTILDVNFNSLYGPIPDELSSLSELMYLRVGVNNLTGNIPAWIGNFSSLVGLSLARNKLSGEIPADLGKLSNLGFFQLYDNELSGPIPGSIFNVSSIYYFSLTLNQLHGQLPGDIGLTLPNLQVFAGGVNNLSGTIPVSLGNASNLEVIDFAENVLMGSIPISLGALAKLQRLNFDDNNLGKGGVSEMNFLVSFTNCTSLEVLGLEGNLFGGKLPEFVGNLSAGLQILTLGSNLLHGTVPLGIGNLINLSSLGLEGNYFNGTVPEEIGKLKELEVLYLNDNQFSGEIPQSLGNLSSLTRMFMEENRLEGSIPQSLGELGNLLVLNLSSNNLGGTIPGSLMGLSSLSISLSMANNSLTGSIPSEIRALTNLNELHLSGNKLTGEIPSSIGHCENLEFLHLDGNSLHGAIPQSLEALRGLIQMNLSHNNLSGLPPLFLSKLPLLQKLDLSFNNFNGEVPMEGVFANSSEVSLQGNDGLCGGVPELHLPSCSSGKNNTRHWIIIPVSISVFVLICCCTSVTIYATKKLRKKVILAEASCWEAGMSYTELFESTNGFSEENLIGSGGFGSVYKGILQGKGPIVAIKVLNLQARGASRSFIDECKALSNIRHRNLLKIVTVCSTVDNKGNDFKCIIFEFMSNGSLDDWLHGEGKKNGDGSLSLAQRLSIAFDVASALDYLHRDCDRPIIHGDIKPSNILLDSDMTARIGDFGLAKILLESPDPTNSLSEALQGSIGYMPPEYAMGGRASTLGDIYGFGILLIEMLTGKRPTDDAFKDGLDIHQFAATALPEHALDVIDPLMVERLFGNYVEATVREKEPAVIIPPDDRALSARKECLVMLLRIGVSCSSPLPSNRMPMSTVVNQLASIRDSFLDHEPRNRRRLL